MEPTIKLLRVIGSPFVSSREAPKDENEAYELYICALKNRMPLLYLSALKKANKLERLKTVYDKSNKKSLMTFNAISRASGTLKDAFVPHTLFKTLRPYPATTVDIDILILESDHEYKKAVATMLNAGYEMLGFGPNSTTVKDPYMDIGVDLYREVAVSYIVYLDKNKLRSQVIEKDIDSSGEPVRTLSPLADLVALIAHSVIKEHMYTLSEYYSTLYYLAQMDESDLTTFIEIIRKNAIVNAAQVHIGITAKLHEVAHGSVPQEIRIITRGIQKDAFEVRRLERSFKTPHKFHPITLSRTLFEKIRREKKTRETMVKQIMSLFNLSFTGSVIRQVVDHFIRESY
jgi:hypothetical protein